MRKGVQKPRWDALSLPACKSAKVAANLMQGNPVLPEGVLAMTLPRGKLPLFTLLARSRTTSPSPHSATTVLEDGSFKKICILALAEETPSAARGRGELPLSSGMPCPLPSPLDDDGIAGTRMCDFGL